MKNNLNIFNLIYSLRFSKPVELIVKKEEKNIIKNEFKYVKKYISYKQWYDCVILYQVNTITLDIEECCNIMKKAIIEKYGK